MNKYRKGKSVETIQELVTLLGEKRWLYLRSTPKHWTVFDNMSLLTLRYFLRDTSSIFIAELNRKEA